jgi:hypothetical protein
MKAKPAAGRTALAPNLAFKLMFHRNVARGDLSSDFYEASVLRRLSCAVCPAVVCPPFGGARRDRTDDLMLAKHALSQLSYGPAPAAGRQ